MPAAHRPTVPARRVRLLALGAGATVAALALVGCTSSKQEAPEPLTIDVAKGSFPDAREAGILEILGEDLDTAYSPVMLDDGSILMAGSSDGRVDDSVGVLDPTTGEIDWVVTADVEDGSFVLPGDVTEKWVTWSIETEEGVGPDDAVPYVFAFDRASKKTHVLADGKDGGGFAPGTNGGRVLIVGDLAVWEGAVPVEDAPAGTEGGTGGGTATDDGEELPLEGEELPLAGEEGPLATSSVFARALDASTDVLAVATEAGGLTRDDCLEGSPATVQVLVEENFERRTVTAEGALGAVLAPVATTDGEDAWLFCGAGGVVETLSADGAVVAQAVLRGEGRDIVLQSDGVADLQVVALTKEWAAVWVGDLDSALGEQLVVHRPTGKVFSLGASESQLLLLRPGVIAFGGAVETPVVPDGEASDVTGGEAGGGDVAADGETADDATDGATDDGIEVVDGDVDVVEDGEPVEGDDEVVEEDFGLGALTTIARLVAPTA
ncbi:hypothetical protein [Sanguibacter sp. HDW7]|uniref:hypothetical protein n=1 Tax=Sanguibacter sp. HDW7 TaxID=2714931 RepID=UPI00140DF213|nr:hypothetical protein [Sanguibacter sp. HDW7]QIK82523.1 hypothetical protein G7063_01985 [Sanguibacter sp. HDW7]